jgi:hypothetical protein
MRSFSAAAAAVLIGLAAGAALAAEDFQFAESQRFAADPGLTCEWVAGVEATFLKPNVAGDAVRFDNQFGEILSSRLNSFDELVGAPRIWLGLEGQRGWGVRARYWELDAFSGQSSYSEDSLLLDPRLATASLGLDAYAVDVELTKHIPGDVYEWLGCFGARYGYRQIDEIFGVADLANGVSSATALSDKAGGTGITLGLEGARRIADTDLQLIANARGSFLFGSHQNTYLGAMAGGGAQLVQGVVANDCSTLSIFELQAGIRWSRRITCLRADVFSQLVFEYQNWSADGCAAFAYDQTLGASTVSGTSLSREVEFTGLAWAIGIKR